MKANKYQVAEAKRIGLQKAIDDARDVNLSIKYWAIREENFRLTALAAA